MKRSLRAEKTVAAARDFQILCGCCTFFVHITLCAGGCCYVVAADEADCNSLTFK